MMSDEVPEGPQCRVGLAPTVSWLRRVDLGLGGQVDAGLLDAAGGDVWVPGLATAASSSSAWFRNTNDSRPPYVDR